MCFAKLKKLAGDWTHKQDKTGKEAVSLRYRVISGGSAVEEEMLPGTPGSMTSIYHLDNRNLVMTQLYDGRSARMIEDRKRPSINNLEEWLAQSITSKPAGTIRKCKFDGQTYGLRKEDWKASSLNCWSSRSLVSSGRRVWSLRTFFSAIAYT